MENQYEQKKNERQEAETRSKRKENLRKVVRWVIAIGIIGGILWGGWLWMKSLAPVGSDRSQTFRELGREHVPDGTVVEYNSNPPTSGSHYVEWAAEKFYDKEIPDGHLIHNLEHGDIWISYNPRIPENVKEQLKTFAGAKVVISARSKNDHDISLAAWTHLDSFDLENGTLDEARISDFIKRYVNRGPEVINGVPMGAKEF